MSAETFTAGDYLATVGQDQAGVQMARSTRNTHTHTHTQRRKEFFGWNEMANVLIHT